MVLIYYPYRLQNSRVFFLKISKEISKAWRKSLTRFAARIFRVFPQSRSLISASFQTFCLTARGYLNTQKQGLFCSLLSLAKSVFIEVLLFETID